MMSRVALAVATGVGALHSTAGASLRSNAGSRNLEDVLYCSSLGCPGGLTPVANAWEVMCNDDPCEVSQCCEAYCSYHPCPDGFMSIDYAWTTVCSDDVCTDAQCCVAGDDGDDFSYTFVTDVDNDALYCNSVGCTGGLTPIADASMTECSSDPCEVSQCCTAYCSSHPCQGGYSPVKDASTTSCPNDVCTDDVCCVASD